MFELLPASGVHPDLKLRWLTTSLVTHTLVGALAIAATRAALDAGLVAPPAEVMLLVLPKAAEPAPPPPVREQESAPVVNLAEAPPQGFQTIEALKEIPTLIPPVDLNQRPFDPRDFTGRGVEGGVARGIFGVTGPVDLDEIYEATTNVPGFEPAMVLSQPLPQYPTSLEAVGLEGRVMVEFVVDTNGRVEPASFRVIESTHTAFEAAARRAILASLFRPARIGKVPVRQLSRQSVRFVAAH
jgi:protein TonB